jgi:hypothetical protein
MKCSLFGAFMKKNTSGKSFRPPVREYFEVKGHYFRRIVMLHELA